MTQIKQILCILAIICASTNLLNAQSVAGGSCGENLHWNLTGTEGNYTLAINGTGAMKDDSSSPWASYRSGIKTVVFIGSVTSIGDNAFHYCSGLTSVTIPNSVTSIGDNAFYYCSHLISITIPNSVISIGNRAFDGCSGLTSVTFGKRVKNIDYSIFSDNSVLTSINVSSGNRQYTSVGGILYNKQQTVLLFCPRGISGTVIIPKSVTSIENYAFYNCIRLTSIRVRAIMPPTFESNISSDVLFYVPCSSFDKYKAAYGWSNCNYGDCFHQHKI
jgi:hypothetical protein